MVRRTFAPDEINAMQAAAAPAPDFILSAVNNVTAADDPIVRLARLALVGELSPGIAHEINNPLFAVLGLVEFLLADAEPGTKAHERLQLVQSTGLEIKDIVRSLVDFARARGDLERAPLDDAAARAAELAHRTSLAKSVELVVRYPDEPVRTRARRSDLEHALLGLLIRALQAAGEPGRVTLDVTHSGDWAVAYVRHTGRALAVDAIEDAESLDTEQLPLAAAARIARAYGGDLTVSTEGGEQVFALYVPAG
jgi:two-component system sensor histidine kinase HydH